MSYKITDTIIVDQSKNISSIGTALFAGPVIIGGGTSTGTVSQTLQVTGTNGAYIGGNLGIGSTNPTSKLWVSGDIYTTGIVTAQVLNASKDPGTGIATDFTNSLFGNGWRVSSPASTTYYKLATLPPGGGGSTFDHLIINGVLGAWTNGNQTPFEITFSNRGSFNYKYVSYGTVRSDVRIIGISTNSNVEIWAQHQASQFTKLVYNIPNSIESIVVSNPTSTTTAPTGTTVFDSSTATPRFIINESDNVGIGTISPQTALDVRGAITVGVGTVGINSVFSTTDIPSWYYTNKSKSITADDSSPQAIYIGAAGTAMFMVGGTGNDVNQYTLSTPYDVSTAGASVGVFSVATQETGPLGIDFNPTGTKMFISGNVAAQSGLVIGGEYVHEYSLSTAWTVSSAGYTTSFYVTTQDTAPQGVAFGNSGSKMYVVGSTGDAVYQYSLSTPYSIASGVTYDSKTLVLGTNPLILETAPIDISFNSTGTVLWIAGSANDRIYEFRLGTAWDISTAVFYDDVYIGFNETVVTGLQVIPEQNVAYIVGSGNDTIYQYSTNTPALEIASSGISSASSIVLNNETRVKDKLYVKGNTHIDGNILTQGTLQVDSNATVAGTLAVTSTLTGNAAVTFDATASNINLGTSQVSGNIILGGTSQTSAITLGRATTSQITNIQAGVSGVGTTKTINFGTGGASGSFTQINIGPTAGVGTVVINSGTNLLVGTTTATGTASQPLQVTGGAYVSGNLGIGITNTSNKLEVIGGDVRFSTASQGDIQITHSNLVSTIKGGTTTQLALGGNGAEVVRINSTGVGIGTTNSLNRLTVYGTQSDTTPILALLSGNSASTFNNGAQIAFGYDGTTNYQHFIQTRHNSANSNNAIDFYVSDGTQNNTLTSGSVHTMSLVSGSVGINTTNPGATLNVVPTATSIAGLFSGTTSSDMVRITQLGTGNALVVEDSTNPDSSPFVVTGIGSVGIGTTNPTSKLHVVGSGNFTSTISVGSTALVTNLNANYLNGQPDTYYTNASNLSSGIVPSARITASSGDFTVGQNLYVTGNLSIGGTSVILNAATLQIKDRDIVLGITTDANNNDVSTDLTATHGGVAIASTVGSPILNLPIGVANSLPTTYKQLMWIGNSNISGYSGMGTDAWVSNYAVSIGNTSTVQNGSRLTVGAGFTVYDTYLDATDIKARNITVSGVSTFSGITTHTASLFGTTATFTGVVTASSFSGNASSASYASTAGIATYATSSGIATYATSSGVSTSVIGGIGSITQLQVTGISTFTNGPVLVGTGTSTGTANQPLQVTGSVYIAGDGAVALSIGATANTTYPIDLRLPSTSSTAAMIRIAPTTTTRPAGIIYSNSGSSNMWTGVLSNSGSGQNLSGFPAYAGVVGLTAGTTPLLLVTNALERVRVTDTGLVGIGTTNPTSTLSVVGDTNITGITTTARLNVGTGGTIITTTSGGLVGIGTASPAFTADIAGDARVTSTNKMRFGGTAGTTNFYIQYNSTTNSLDFVAG
jgi:hypothetical protein